MIKGPGLGFRVVVRLKKFDMGRETSTHTSIMRADPGSLANTFPWGRICLVCQYDNHRCTPCSIGSVTDRVIL